jgi:uncharacterized protein (UPF0548 family)
VIGSEPDRKSWFLGALPNHVEHVIEREALRLKEREHVKTKKVEQLFRDML